MLSPMVKLASVSTCSTPRKLNQIVTQSSRRSQEPSKTGWRSALWPTSPVFKRKPESSPIRKSLSNNEDSDASSTGFRFTMRKRDQQPQDDDTVDVESKLCNAATASCSPGPLDLRSPDIKVSLAAIRPHSKSIPHGDIVVSKCTELSRSPCEPVDSLGVLKKASLMEEFEEFLANPDAKILLLPDYFSEEEKEIVKQVADEVRVGCQIGERNIAIFKLGNSEKMHPYHPVVHRHRDSTLEDLYVDVSELAQQGKDGFIARLRLRRLNSGSGMRHNMLWDVAQLGSSDGVAESVNEGEGGVYAVQSRSSGQKLAMFKPAEEERFVREGLFPGEGAVREEAAYELDSRMNGFSGVPPTAVARLQLSNIGRAKQGAVQRFMMGSVGSMEGFGMPHNLDKAEAFVPVDQVHRIGLLDIRLFNTDRHPGNILLIGERAPYTMVPIDHGCILPSWFHLSEARFDWLEYPQTKVPFSAVAMHYIESLDVEADAVALRRLGIREECIVTMRICTLFLKLAARQGKTLHWMGTFMQRDGCFENPSSLEHAIERACVATGIPFSFVPNEYGEQKGSIPVGIVSRRPPQVFYEYLEGILREAVSE